MRVSDLVSEKLFPNHVFYRDGEALLELTRTPCRNSHVGLIHAVEQEVPQRTIIEIDRLIMDVTPSESVAGFIFHLGRVGSTLVTKMFDTLEGCQVVSESMALSGVLSCPYSDPQSLIAERHRKIVQLFCCLGETRHQRTVFKLPSWEILKNRFYGEVYPEVNKCLLVRNPEEIMTALIHSPPGWLQRSAIRRLLLMERKRTNDDLLNRSLMQAFSGKIDYFQSVRFVDFIGSALLALVETANESITDFLVIDHKDLKIRVPSELSPLFGFEVTENQRQKMLEICKVDAKSKNDAPYQDDSERKHIEATPRIIKWCELIRPLLDQLAAPSGHSNI